MTTACKNGNCEVLFDENKQCDFRQQNKSMLCIFIGPTTGKCMHSVANKPKRKNGTHVWSGQNEAAFVEYRVRRGKL